MKRKILLSMLSMLIAASLIAQESNNAIHQKVNEKESIINGKKIKEKTVDITITGNYDQETYDYTFESSKSNQLSISLESNNTSIAFEVLKDNKNISGKNLLKSWEKEGSVNGAFTIRMFLPKHLKDSVSFKLQISSGY